MAITFYMIFEINILENNLGARSKYATHFAMKLELIIIMDGFKNCLDYTIISILFTVI